MGDTDDNNNHGAGDLRADLEASFQELNSDGSVEAPSPEAAETSSASVEGAPPDSSATDDASTASEEGADTAPGRARDEYGRFIPKAQAAKPGAPDNFKEPGPTLPVKPTTNGATPTKGAPAQGATPAALPPPPPPADAAPAAKPPQAWKATVREKWAALPPEVQSEVVRREHEHTALIEETAEVRKGWSAFNEAVRPFEAMIRAEGSTPLQAIGPLLETAAALRMAPPHHKAGIVAQMVKNFGIPVDELARALDPGAGQQGNQAGQPIQEFRDPRLDQLLVEREQEKHQHAQAMEARQRAAVSAFKQSHEFVDDVGQDMADLLEMANRRGVELSLEDAYSRACKMHPDISQVLQQREAARSANATVASTQKARDASSSVKTQPANSSNGVHKGSSIRDDLMAAAQELSGR